MASYGIIFDLDGTLADTMDDLKTAMNSTLVKLGYETRTKFELVKFLNNGSREFVRRSLPTAVQKEDFIIESALDIYGREYEKCFCDKTRAYPGIYEVIQLLKKEKFKLGVLSNKPDRFVKTIISKLFGYKTFDFVMGQSDLPCKPDPSSALYVAKELGVKPSRCIFIGDSDVDIKTAKNAEMRSIGVSWGYRSPELLVDTGANYIAQNPAEILEHALECVRIIKLEKKLNKEHKHQPEPIMFDQEEAKEATGATMVVNIVTEEELKKAKKKKKK